MNNLYENAVWDGFSAICVPEDQGLEHVVVYLDDILVTGRMQEEHLHTLEEVLNRLQMRLKREKCIFMVPKVEYLGHVLSREGI